MPRNINAHFICRRQNTQGIGVRGGKDCGAVQRLPEQLLGQLISALNGRAGIFAVEKMRRKVKFMTGLHISVRSELMSRGTGTLAEIENVPVAQLIEVLGAQIGAPAVVNGHIALGLAPQVFTEEHRGDLIQIGFEVIVGFRALRDDEDPVHLPAQQQLEHGLFLLQVRTGITEHDIITVGTGADFRVVGKLRHELVVHRGDHKSDEVGALGHHGPGHKVGGVAHLIAQLQNPFPGLAADLGAAGKGTGYGSIGDACCFGDIL